MKIRDRLAWVEDGRYLVNAQGIVVCTIFSWENDIYEVLFHGPWRTGVDGFRVHTLPNARAEVKRLLKQVYEVEVP